MKEMVSIDKNYIRKQVKIKGYKYTDISKLLGFKSKGSLTGMISAERIRKDYLIQIARIVGFPYEDALKNQRILKSSSKSNITRHDIDKIVQMQKEINVVLIEILNKI